MQLFIVDENPFNCARFLENDNKRLNKQIIECAQLLSNALWLNGAKGAYKLTHENHPISKWVSERRENYIWTYLFFRACILVRKNKIRKGHKCEELTEFFRKGAENLPRKNNLNSFINCTPYKNLNVFEAYKKHLKVKWGN